MPVYAEMTGDALRAIEFRTNVAVEQAVSATAQDFLQILKEEIPWDSIKNDVEISYSVKTKGQTTATIIIGANTESSINPGVMANEYIWELWKGNQSDREITAKGKAMKFDRWKNGPDELRGKDGFFHFKRVNHPPIEGDDFIGRSIARLRLIVNQQFGRRFANYFKNIRR